MRESHPLMGVKWIHRYYGNCSSNGLIPKSVFTFWLRTAHTPHEGMKASQLPRNEAGGSRAWRLPHGTEREWRAQERMPRDWKCRYGLPCDGVLTWGQDFYGLNLLVPKEEASEICHQLVRMQQKWQSCQRPNINKAIMWSMQTIPSKVIASVYVSHDQPWNPSEQWCPTWACVASTQPSWPVGRQTVVWGGVTSNIHQCQKDTLSNITSAHQLFLFEQNCPLKPPSYLQNRDADLSPAESW